MAIEVMSEVITARRGPWRGGDLLVLLMLASYADPDGTKIFPRVATLARACRMKVRNTQICLSALQDDGVLIKVGEANGRPGTFNEYAIDLTRLQSLQGCKVCRGAVCCDEGCNPMRGRVQNPVAHIDKRPGPVLETPLRARRAGSVDKPDATLAKIREAIGGVKFDQYAGKATPQIIGGALRLLYPTQFRADRAEVLRNEIEDAYGGPVEIVTALKIAGTK